RRFTANVSVSRSPCASLRSHATIRPVARTAAPKVDGRVERAEKQRRERRANVLQTARRVFSAKGYHDTSISDLIEAAGIARRTFYLYFISKRAIFEELL